MSDDPAAILVYRLVDTSIRWGFLIAALAVWLAIRPPRRAATRHALCTAVLLAGPLLAVSPRWGDAAIPWPAPAVATPAPAPPSVPLHEPPPPLVMPREPIVETIAEIEPIVAVEIPAAPPPEPIDWPKVAWRSAAGVWAAGTIMMLARLLLGAGSLARWSRRAVSASADDLSLFDECRAELPTSRPVRLARHSGTTSPVVVGGFRPLILLPGAEAWDERSTDQRRAALWHELAHVRRYDDAWKLLQELIRVPSWHHPLVHWLLSRLDRERELLCDEAAVSLGDDPKGLARLLLELSRRPTGRSVPSTSLPFLDRRTTAIRIERLLEDDMTRSLSRPSLFRTLTIGPLALVAALGIGGLRVRLSEASEPPRQEPPPAAGRPAPKFDVFSGEIIDSQGRPIAGVTGVEIPIGPSSRRVVTDAEGRFTLEGANLTKHTPFVFWAPGYIPARGLVKFISRPQATKWRFPLREASPFSGQVVDDHGEPIAGATVRLKRIVASEKQGDNGFKTSTFPIGADWPAPGLSGTTAADGSFTFPYASSTVSTDVDLEIRTGNGRLMVPRVEWKDSPFNPRNPFTIGLVAVSTVENTRITVVPAARLEGSVASQVQGVDLSQLRVRTWPSIGRSPGPFPLDETPSVPVAADGRFTIDGLNAGSIDLRVEGPGRDQDWIASDARNIQPILGATTKATLTLRTGVEVVGKVVERGTGRPASGVTLGASDPKLMFGHHAARVTTDAQGRYKLRMEHGRRIFGVSVHAGWDQWQEMESKRFVTVPEGVARFEAPTIEMPPYVAARVRVVDADHRPLAGMKVTACVGSYFPTPVPALPLTGGGEDNFTVSVVSDADAKSFSDAQRLKSAEFWTVFGETDADGRLAVTESSDLVPGDEPVKVWVDLPDGTKHESRFASATGGVEVVLPPRQGAADVFHGMVVDPQNRPIAGAVGVEAPLGRNARRVVTDADGRFTLDNVDRNKPVRFVFSAPGYFPASPTIPFVDRPQDTKWVCKLQEAAPFSGRIVDAVGKPITGATVRLTQVAVIDSKDGQSGSCDLVPLQSDSPFPETTTTTNDDGSFTFPYASKSAATEVNLTIRTRDGRMMVPQPFAKPITPRPGFPWTIESVAVSTTEKTQITVVPAARLSGKITSQVPGVDLSQLRVKVRSSLARFASLEDVLPSVPVTADGWFAFDCLSNTKVDLRVEGPGRHQDWIVDDARDIQPTLGATTEASLSLRPGVEVIGKVVERKTGRPLAGVAFVAQVADMQFFDQTVQVRTDVDGRYRLRLSPRRYVFGVDPRSHALVPQVESKRFVTIPDGVAAFEPPTIEAPPHIVPRIRVIDADRRPVADASVTVSAGKPTLFVPADAPAGSWTTTIASGDKIYSSVKFAISFIPSVPGAKPQVDDLLLKGVEYWPVFGKTGADGLLVAASPWNTIPGDEPAMVEVVAPGGQTHKLQVHAAGEEVVKITLPRREGGADEFRGMVVDPQGQPLAGVVGVEANPRVGGRLTVRTDAGGRFALKGVDLKDRSRFLFWAPGCVPSYGGMSPDYRPGGLEWLLKFPAAAPFSCRLVDERGKPVAGATVRLAQIALVRTEGDSTGRSGPVALDIDSLVPNTTTTTAADGSFSFPHGCKDWGTEVRLEIRTADGRPMIPQPASDRRWLHNAWLEKLVAVSTKAQTQITAVPSARVEGKVRSEVPDVDLSRLWIRVRLTRGRMDNLDLNRSCAVPVAADGKFTLDYLDAEKVDLLVEGPGRDQDWITNDALSVSPTLGATTEASVTLRRGVEMIGKVVERGTNRPMAGATVGLYMPEIHLLNRMARTRTDAEGRYRIRGESMIRQMVGVDVRGDSPILRLESKRGVQVPEGVERFEVPTIEVPPYVVARFRVVDADHRPVAGARISWPGRDGLMGLRNGTTNADGRLTLDPIMASRIKIPSDAPFALKIASPGGQEQPFEIQPTADGLVEVVLPPREEPAMELKGVVLDPEGRPVPGATVVIEDAGNGPLPGRLRASLTSDDRGRYSWKVDPSVSLVCVLARAPGFVSAVGSDLWATNPRFNAETGRDFNVKLDRPGEFGGVLVDRDGHPMAGARIQATRAQFYQGTGDNRMIHRIRLPIPDDPQGLHAPGRLPVVATTAVDGSFQFSESLPNTETTLWLEITDGQGRPVTVRPARINSQGDPAPLNAAEFRPGDRPTLAAVPASWIEGRVSTEIPGLDLSQLSVEAVGREPKSDAFSVHPRGLNRVSVRADGRYRIGPIVPAAVDLVLHGPDECKLWTYRAKDDLKPPVDGTLHVDLEAIEGVEVVGKVIDSMQGRGLPGAVVEARPGGRTATTDLDGLYHLRLPEGEARIIVRALPAGFESIPAVGAEHKIIVPWGVERFEAPRIVTAKLTDLR
ncbi:carboxypeptidase regulatory-like domain-containing protein [Paludisphaera rhizosphaerae]|uniref:carboxypeptidase regulatory-like domain-containing protein n=1 Tax=Paludisphaera rhizosphaerae TaxID=2711216 RepID=UPI0013EA8663|nr:carboxypeptidase regulatory-like domain-containing protein [Paludisphaera rhizosphaerae]